MIRLLKKSDRIRGKIIPARRFTIHALSYFIVFIALPILGLAIILDLIGWIIAIKVFNFACYGVACFF
jgi:hypothetical protein